jgi:phosphoribosylanthranilate isomerase
MKLKICGLKYPTNFIKVQALEPNLMGFVFVESSPRFVENTMKMKQAIRSLTCDKVGVFVNSDIPTILKTMESYGLMYAQLHGDESPEEVIELSKQSKVIKAFQVDENFDFRLVDFSAADYFLFDTKGTQRGGNGEKFDWKLLEKYQGEIPFFLSGGISLEDVNKISNLNHQKLVGIDVNSAFEDYPGFKNIELLENLKSKLHEV